MLHEDVLDFFLFHLRWLGPLGFVTHATGSEHLRAEGQHLTCGFISGSTVDQGTIRLQHKVGVLEIYKNYLMTLDSVDSGWPSAMYTTSSTERPQANLLPCHF